MTTPALTELLLRDPQHPAVRALLMERYRQLGRLISATRDEQALIARVLGLPQTTRKEQEAIWYQARQSGCEPT